MRQRACILAMLLSFTLLLPRAWAAGTDNAVSLPAWFRGEPEQRATVWDDGWFLTDSTVFHQELARTALLLCAASYVPGADGGLSPAALESSLAACGFRELQSRNFDYPFSRQDNDVTAYTFGLKRIPAENGASVSLLAVVVKGTSGNVEWYSNFNIGDGPTHRGFSLARDDLLKNLAAYRTAQGLDGQPVRYFVTGHSRGAAVANLTAASLLEDAAGKSRVWGYTFATPAVSVLAQEEGYESIFNVVSQEDFVTRLPLADWNYRRYGRDLPVPSRSSYGGNYDALYPYLSAYYADLTGGAYSPYSGSFETDTLVRNLYALAPTVRDYQTAPHAEGTETTTGMTTSEYFHMLSAVLANDDPSGENMRGLLSAEEYAPITRFFLRNQIQSSRVSDAHSPAGYYSWLSVCGIEDLFPGEGAAFFRRVTLPASLSYTVYDGSGKVVGSASGDTAAAVSGNTALAVNPSGDTAVTLDLPVGETYDVRMAVREAGGCVVEEISVPDGRVTRTVRFSDAQAGDVLSLRLLPAPGSYTLVRNGTETLLPISDTLS